MYLNRLKKSYSFSFEGVRAARYRNIVWCVGEGGGASWFNPTPPPNQLPQPIYLLCFFLLLLYTTKFKAPFYVRISNISPFISFSLLLYPQCDPYIERKAPPWDAAGAEKTYNLKRLGETEVKFPFSNAPSPPRFDRNFSIFYASSFATLLAVLFPRHLLQRSREFRRKHRRAIEHIGKKSIYTYLLL